MPYINAIGTAVPAYQVSQAQALDFMQQKLAVGMPELSRKLQVLYKKSTIAYRYSVLKDYTENVDYQYFGLKEAPSTQTRMKIYQQEALPLALKAVEDCWRQVSFPIQKITHLITVSCTGMYAPGLDIDLVNRLALSPSVERTCINFMGCYATFNALKLANTICKASPEAKVLIVAVELCTLHLQNSLSEDDILSASLFGDGAGAILVSDDFSERALKPQYFYCGLAMQGQEEMAWRVGDFGFEMRLSSYVPKLLEGAIPSLIRQFFQKYDLQPTDIELFAMHPGGKRILEAIEKSLSITKAQNWAAYEVLAEYGNMSSVTIIFVWQRLWQQLSKSNTGKKILSLAFGPGLTLESCILEAV